MNFHMFILTILVLCSIPYTVYATKHESKRIFRRQTQPSADRMVQDIIKWVQNVYIKNSRRIRQGILNEYLPPSNTERPRPFQSGYPPSGITPLPIFPFPTSGSTSSTNNEHLQPIRNDTENDILLPPKENGYSKSELPLYRPTTVSLPSSTTYKPTDNQPSPFSIYTSTNVPYDIAHTTSQEPFPTRTPNELLSTSPPEQIPNVYQTTSKYPDSTFKTLYTSPNEQPTITTSSKNTFNDITTGVPVENEPIVPEGTTSIKTIDEVLSSTMAPSTPVDKQTTDGSIIQSSTDTNTRFTTALPENLPGKETNINPTDHNTNDDQHPPHIHKINAECGKDMMKISVEFNREFNGIIYSKGYYNNSACRYVEENSGKKNYIFTVNLKMCGTEFIDAMEKMNQSYLENVLVFQNESGIQEVWDTVRSVRCLWESNLKDSLSVSFSIGMLNQEIVTFSGDTAMAKLDIVFGRGPFGEPAKGLVKIGEQMTLVVSVSGDPEFDLYVKNCRATDAGNKNYYALTDENGCILKPKLFGAFQKTRETGNTGASIIAYAYFNAFKFPDEMDLIIECNIELCKSSCEMCNESNQIIEPRRRRRRSSPHNNSISDGILIANHMRIILPEDSKNQIALEPVELNHICMSTIDFILLLATLISISLICAVLHISAYIKRRNKLNGCKI